MCTLYLQGKLFQVVVVRQVIIHCLLNFFGSFSAVLHCPFLVVVFAVMLLLLRELC